MNIDLTGDGVEITDAIRQFATEKFSRLQRHYDRIMSVRIIFSVEKLIQKAEATLNLPGDVLHACSESADLYSAIDLLVDKLDAQIKKYKGKVLEQRNHRT